MKPIISIALATFNGERFLKQQLQSIKMQTWLPDELVVSDDGSSDRTLEIIDDFSKDAPFEIVMLDSGVHVGCADNFVRALRSVRGDLVAFCDQDDLWATDKLEKQARMLTVDSGISLVSHSWRVLSDHVERRVRHSYLGHCGRYKKNDVRSLPARPTPGMTILMRADVARRITNLWPSGRNLELVRHLKLPILEHDTFAVDAAITLGDIAYLRDPLADRRVHEENLSNSIQNRRSQANWSRSHRGLTSWETRGIRIKEWSTLYDEFLDRINEPDARKSFEVRSNIYEWTAKSYEARASIYRCTRFFDRLKALRQLAKGGYAYLGKKNKEAFLTFIRDVFAVVGWR